jgi:hypothetical protein
MIVLKIILITIMTKKFWANWQLRRGETQKIWYDDKPWIYYRNGKEYIQKSRNYITINGNERFLEINFDKDIVKIKIEKHYMIMNRIHKEIHTYELKRIDIVTVIFK